MERNQRLRNDKQYKRDGIKNDWYHFATIPAILIMEFKTKHNLDVFNDDDLPAIEKLLAGPDYSKFRTVSRV